MIYDDITQTIGETPMVRLRRMSPRGSRVYVKIERNNPGGSVKDRPVLAMINEAEADGRLKKGGLIVEPTSGNTGIALAMIAAARGYKAVLVMPDTMSRERVAYMTAYGAEIVFTPGEEGMKGSVDAAVDIAGSRGGFILGQFDNPANRAAHRVSTGVEILRDLPDVDCVVAGFGTGGTATGIAMALRDAGSKAVVHGIEPAESPLLSRGRAGPHRIQGIGANFVPGNLDPDLIEAVTVGGDDAIAAAVRLAREEGIFAGISSGAAVHHALGLADAGRYKRIVAILPDGGEKYMSTGIYD